MALATADQSAVQALRAGQKYWRIRQTIADLDWFNCDVSPAAICIGPDSDIDMVPVTYYDLGANNATQSKVMQVSVGNPITTRLDAKMSSVQRDGTTPGRLLINSGGSNLRRVDATYFSPVLDLIVYFEDPAFLPRVRSPYTANTTFSFAAGTAEQTVFTLPYYGRRNFSFTVRNNHASNTITAWRLLGLRFRPALTPTVLELQISPAAGGAANTIAAVTTVGFDLSTARFDALQLVAIQSANGTSLAYQYEATDE